MKTKYTHFFQCDIDVKWSEYSYKSRPSFPMRAQLERVRSKLMVM